jgi:2-polyprenyl-6-methoxyphenol hydroxylase-like FAD-dependent oxidoreductase
MMLGVLLARAGLDVVVLEKHGDFLRDFRGDTVHPSTLEVVHELGWLDDFLSRPHQKIYQVGGQVSGQRVTLADFSHLPVRAPFIALMPQWDFLDFLADHGRTYAGFDLRMRAEAVSLVEENGRIAGLVAETPSGPLEIRADLTVGADGRHSIVRERAGLQVEHVGAPIDVLWMRLSKRGDDPSMILGNIAAGHIFVMLDRGDYWQCAFVIPKGGHEAVRAAGLEQFRRTLLDTAPFLGNRVNELQDWNQIKLLTVLIDRLREWYRDGLLCIGDAAHAMSPVGGVGINLAIQDAVAAANILTGPLKTRRLVVEDLRAVQRRREFPTRVTQRMQVLVQNNVLLPSLQRGAPARLPRLIGIFNEFPALRRIPARIVGLGFRPEHVETPAVARRQQGSSRKPD